ncbi:LamG domain-containing protein [Streptomyces sp. NBC_00503]|uniref:LamG domain-containing protein n=1 Tax=Streptomyces sp. NBC_00503 TaxID=2903659 RepID=UPI002E80CEA3|nr:LamG domain-containing protein [Streptomyces sp. NBC_00503]WUD82868.1 LamG domain-containing protein [Streptomyces sp. NBC_00503]
MTDGTDRPQTPQREPGAPDNGGYGYPQGQIPAGGYGYPQAGRPGGNGYPPAPGAPGAAGFGPPADGQAPPAGYGYPQPGPYQQGPYQPAPPVPGPFEPPADEPDWNALAEGAEQDRHKKRQWAVIGGATALVLLVGGGAFLLLGNDDGGSDDAKPLASGSPSVSASPSPSVSGSKAPVDNTPTVAGDPTVLRDRSGKAGLKMGPEASAVPIEKRFEFRATGTPNSYAESQKGLVDVSKSFTVTARISNSASKGRQIAVSQGNEKTFSFELGSDEVNGKPAWIFRVQTNKEGADNTTATVVAEGRTMDSTMTELTGTYNYSTKMITLFVDGKQINEAKVPGVHNAPGPLELGRTRSQGNWAGAWAGAMDSLRVYRIALSPEQVDDQKPGKLDASIKPVGSWLLF